MKKSKIHPLYKLVVITWEDSQLGFQGWKFIEEQERQMPTFISVGFLIHADNKCKILYPHIKDTEDKDILSGSGDIKIPNSAILSMRELT